MKLVDLYAEYRSIRAHIDRALQHTLKRGSYILGEKGVILEQKIAAFVEADYAIGLNSGTDALALALKALGVGKGDEVITSPFSFIATAEVIANAGAKPVFVDIDPKTFNIAADKIETAVTKKTKVILPVHLYGQMAEMEPIVRIARKHSLAVLEDAAQAIGATETWRNGSVKHAGSTGDAACFSFFPTKNLGAYGDAGMVTTHHAALDEKIRLARNHGSRKKYIHEFLAISSRLDELQAAILLAKFPHLPKWNNTRQNIAAMYTKAFSGLGRLEPPFIRRGGHHVFHQYTIRTPLRDKLKDYLKERGVPTSIHYPLPIHRQPAFAYLKHAPGSFREAERAAKEVLSLPLHPFLKKKEINKIIESVQKFFKLP
jgi:dTDP-4-amino-4,6-dideoxygalactose transaminase